MRPRREKKIFYPRSCPTCEGVYLSASTYSRHLSGGVCQRRQAPIQNQTITNHIGTQNITNNNAPVNDNERLLQDRIQQLEQAYQALLNNDVLPLLGKDDDYIYVLQERHAMEMRLPVYKVGATSEIHRRSADYAKGSKLLFCRIYKGGKRREAALHQHLRTKYKQRIDFGTEFVEGDGNKIIDDVISFMGIAADGVTSDD